MVQITTLKTLCTSVGSSCGSFNSGHNLTNEDSFSIAASAKCDVALAACDSRETLRKLVRGGGLDECLMMTGSGSSARKNNSMDRAVYTVTKPGSEKGSGKWDQLKSIVRQRRHSKERQESHEGIDKVSKQHVPGGTAMNIEQEKEMALAELDSVISLYHKKNCSAGNSNTIKSSKKREKESGGTWPKYKGGALSTWDPVPQPRRDRPPLSMYAPVNYEEKPSFDVYHQVPVKHSTTRDSSNLRSTSSSPHRDQAFSSYKNIDTANIKYSNEAVYSIPKAIYTVQPGIGGTLAQQPIYPGTGVVRSCIDESKEDVERERENRLGSLTPSDTSLDFSVRSGNVGKEELEYYVKKNIVKCPFSDSESNMSPVEISASPQPLSLPITYGGYRSCQLRQLHELASNSRGGSLYPRTGLYSSPSAGLRSPPTFVPYSPFTHYSHQHPHPHTTVSSTLSIGSSLRYSSPPVLTPSPFLPTVRDLRMSSPGHDVDGTPLYEQRVVGSPSPSHSSGIRSPITAGYYQLPTSPSQEFGNNNSNNINKLNTTVTGQHNSNTSLNNNKHIHQHNYQHPKSIGPLLISAYGGGNRGFMEESIAQLPLLPSASLLLPPSTCPPPYHDYQRTVTTMPRKRDEDKIRLSSTLGGLIKSCSVDRGGPLMDPGIGHDGTASQVASNSGRSPEQPRQIYYSVHNRQFGDHQWQCKRPEPGEIRNILLEKDNEPLGIQIRCLQSGGVFVSAVTVNSLAEQVGLIIGDQLLEVCGINMRSATKVTASTVLSQCGKSVTILVQNNTDKYEELDGWAGSSSGSSLLEGPSRSGTPTPCNSPKPSSHHPQRNTYNDHHVQSTPQSSKPELSYHHHHNQQELIQQQHEVSVHGQHTSTLNRAHNSTNQQRLSTAQQVIHLFL